MNIGVVLGQMVMIFVMIFIGAFLFKSGHLSNESTRQLSWLIVNITNPITLLCAALKEENKIGPKEIGIAFVCFIVMFAFLITVAYILPRLLRVQENRRYEYRMLTIFGNVGFIGIPFSAAVLGDSSLIYVAICGLTFNMIMYTYGMKEMQVAAARNNSGISEGVSKASIINTGTIMAVVTLAVYLVDVNVPAGVSRFLDYIGSCTTFLSMVVLGVSVAQMVPKKVFTNKRLYIFIVVRQILIPIIIAYALKLFGIPQLMLQTIVVMASMPAANMPLMVANQFGLQEENISSGIILTTIASIITIPIVMGVL